jgi:hypothetical protein
MAAQVAAAAYSERLDDEMIETSYTADQPNEHVDHGFAESGIDDFQEVSVEEAEEFVEPMIEPQAVSEIDNSISYDETLQMDVSPMMVQPAAEVETCIQLRPKNFAATHLRRPQMPLISTRSICWTLRRPMLLTNIISLLRRKRSLRAATSKCQPFA